MGKTIATSVMVVSVNHLTDEEVAEIEDNENKESVEEVAEDLESTVELVMAKNVFQDADELPIISVNTEAYDNWDSEEAEKLLEQ